MWWDPDRFNWRSASEELALYCSNYFNVWWDPKRFNWEHASYALAQGCNLHFEKWWNPEKYVLEEDSLIALFTHCSRYIEIWLPTVMRSHGLAKVIVKTTVRHVDKVKKVILSQTLEGGDAQ